MKAIFAAVLSLFVGACQSQPPPPPPPPPPPSPPAVEVAKESLALFKVAPRDFPNAENPSTPEKIALGRALYFDTRLSKNHDVSCNSCHQLDKWGVDSQPTSPGHKRQLGGRNSPTVYFAAGHIAQFWDGRASDVEAQAKGPVLNPVEMAMPSEKAVVTVLKSIPGYKAMFAAAFAGAKEPISYDNMAKAIGAFERQLVTTDRFDAFLAGKSDALSDLEKRGLNKFVELNCTMCHNGPLLGGTMYQKLGLMKPFEDPDMGRFDVTKNEAEKQFFKVASLRNIEKTGPYFHNGKVATLEEAVTLMAHHQLSREVEAGDVATIVAFLKALTGELPKDYIAMPDLPPSGPKTPKPNSN